MLIAQLPLMRERQRRAIPHVRAERVNDFETEVAPVGTNSRSKRPNSTWPIVNVQIAYPSIITYPHAYNLVCMQMNQVIHTLPKKLDFAVLQIPSEQKRPVGLILR